MSKLLPKNKFLQGIFAPLEFECNIHDCKVIGTIPQELNGTLYRIGANPQYVYSKNYHVFEGDGMVHAISFKNGIASYANKWVRTNKFAEERQAHDALFAGFRDSEKITQILNGKFPDTVNTNIIYHADKLLALNESVVPFSVNKDDLSTIGKYNFNEKLQGPMTAHPRICAKTQELFIFSYLSRDINGKSIDYCVASATGEIIHSTKIDVPYKSLMHDFAITEDYVIFSVFPLTCSVSRLLEGKEFYKWEPQLGSYFGIMPRYGTNNDVVWIKDASCFAMHIAGAYQEGNLITMDACLMDNIPDNADGFSESAEVFPSYLTRWVFDIKNQKLISRVKLDDIASEFPKIDERFTGQKYNNVYTTTTIDKSISYLFFDSLTHYDLKNHRKKVHHFGIDSIPLEPIFVPKNSKSPEGEGLLLSYVYRKQEDRSDLVILDAQNIDKEPLAIIRLPHRVPFTFHGSWVAN